MVGWLILFGLWALFGVPYGIKIYRGQRANGVEVKPAILWAVLRGVSAPVELVVKGIIGAFKEIIK